MVVALGRMWGSPPCLLCVALNVSVLLMWVIGRCCLWYSNTYTVGLTSVLSIVRVELACASACAMPQLHRWSLSSQFQHLQQECAVTK